MLGKESINPVFTSTKFFHNQQVMKFVPAFSPMDSQPSNIIFISDSLQIVKAGDVREVWDTSHCLKNIKSLVRFVLVDGIDDKNQSINEFGK